MNWAASHLESRKAVQSERLIQSGSYKDKEREKLFLAQV